jgi:hypothetical protein
MNVLDLPDLARETFILALEDVADIIMLERTNRELRDWITQHDIYRRWERKHLGKTDKWRLLLLQELGFKGANELKFKHDGIEVDIETVDLQRGRHFRLTVTRDIDASFEEVFTKWTHYLRGATHPVDVTRQSAQSLARSHANHNGLYYFAYDLLRIGYQFVLFTDVQGIFDSERLIRSQCTLPLTHQCSSCSTKFCNDSECSEWVNHKCT